MSERESGRALFVLFGASVVAFLAAVAMLRGWPV